MEIRTSDALQIVRGLAMEYLASGQADLPDAEAEEDAARAIEHLEKMISCLKDGKTFFACGPA